MAFINSVGLRGININYIKKKKNAIFFQLNHVTFELPSKYNFMSKMLDKI